MIGPPCLSVGVFRRLLHLVDPGSTAITFRGIRLHAARCGAMALVTGPTEARPWPWCTACQKENRG